MPKRAPPKTPKKAGERKAKGKPAGSLALAQRMGRWAAERALEEGKKYPDGGLSQVGTWADELWWQDGAPSFESDHDRFDAAQEAFVAAFEAWFRAKAKPGTSGRLSLLLTRTEVPKRLPKGEFWQWETLDAHHDENVQVEGLPTLKKGDLPYTLFSQLHSGQPAKVFPPNAEIRLRSEEPGTQLTGALSTTHNFLVVHREVRAVIERHCKGVPIDYLPFTLLDHRGGVGSQDYVIVNPLGAFTAKNKKLPQLFRLAYDRGSYWIRSKLAAALLAANFTGIQLLHEDPDVVDPV